MLRHGALWSLIFCSLHLSAQRTQIYEVAERFYDYGVELYEKKQFIPAEEAFTRYLEETEKIEHHRKDEARIFRWICQIQNGHRSSATDLVRFLKRNPEHTLVYEAYYQLAEYYFTTGRYRRAVRYYEDSEFQSHQSAEKRYRGIFNMGYAYFRTGDNAEARAMFSQLINKKNPYQDKALYYYGYQCYVLKDFDCAESTFKKIEDSGPKTMRLYLAQIAYSRGQYEKALEEIKDIQIDKHEKERLFLMGKAYYQMGQTDLADRYFQQSVDTEEAYDPNEEFQIANVHYLKGRYRAAASRFVRLTGEESELGQVAQFKLADCFLQLGEKEKAFNAFFQAKSKDHDLKVKEYAHFNYAKLATELKRNDVAIDAVSAFILTYPSSYYADPAKGMLAQLFLTTKNYKSAIEVLERITNFDQNTKKAYQKITFHRGEELYANREYQTAYTVFKKSLKYPVSSKLEAEAYFWLGEISYQIKDYQGAISNYNRFLAKPQSESSAFHQSAYYGMGYAYYQQKRYPQALNYFRKYDGRKGRSTSETLDTYTRLGDCNFLTRQYSAAIISYQKAINLNQNKAEYAMFQQAILYGLINETDRKINNLKRIESIFSRKVNSYVDDAIYELGRVYLQNGQTTTAKATFNRLISTYPNSQFVAKSMLNLGLIEFNNEDEEAALATYKSVVKKYPRSSEAKDALSYIESIYVNSGRGDEYISYVNSLPYTAVSLTAQDSILYESAINKYREGKCELAINNFKKYLDRFGDKGFFTIPAHYFRGECERKQGLLSDAKQSYKHVVEVPGNDYEERALLRLAVMSADEKNCEDALKYFGKLEPVASSKSNYVLSLMGQMRCYYENGQYDLAKEKAVDVLPIENVQKRDLVEVNMVLGEIQFKAENWKTAGFHFNYVVETSPNETGAMALYKLAVIEFNQENLDSSRSTIYRLNDDFSPYEYWVVKGFILLADIYVEEEDYFQARATLQSIIDGYDGDQDLLEVCRRKLDRVDALEKGLEVESSEEINLEENPEEEEGGDQMNDEVDDF